MTTAVIRWKPRSSKPSRSIAVAASAAYPCPWWSRPSAKPTSPWRSEAHLSSTSPITVPVARTSTASTSHWPWATSSVWVSLTCRVSSVAARSRTGHGT